ncbi:hypothetical protein IQ247_05500 [Plectonema cf. radiosum LEGE 06105]|uniref:Uncharacterized protein n=1 Tax=Plectonema cf. radiosum LEGE 06105 TaxID=945769 RepID=A0A8J7FDB9_9CYAN|nr:hypothetical protein [Plectonema radiosum]MBE9212171.1 hypothetical protein [Plectonema cf. radiosum LEGE 06105]
MVIGNGYFEPGCRKDVRFFWVTPTKSVPELVSIVGLLIVGTFAANFVAKRILLLFHQSSLEDFRYQTGNFIPRQISQVTSCT